MPKFSIFAENRALKKIAFVLVLLVSTIFAHSQNIDGLWRGTIIMYVYDVYMAEMNLKKMPNETFTANLKITNGFYKGEFNISGNVCNRVNLEITAIILLKENESSNWIDCLNGTLDLSEGENILSFTDTWRQTLEMQKNYAACKVKFIQKDMFQCLRSAYLVKQNYDIYTNAFDDLWNKHDRLEQEAPQKNKETYIVEKKEEKEPIIEKKLPFKNRDVVVKSEIQVSNKEITIEYWDKYNFDGDSISLYLNDRPILENVLLTKIKSSVVVQLDKKNNYLTLHALNLGKEPPNTAAITVKDGKKIQNIMLYSDLEKSGTLKIVLKE